MSFCLQNQNWFQLLQDEGASFRIINDLFVREDLASKMEEKTVKMAEKAAKIAEKVPKIAEQTAVNEVLH
jgi:hypothetical protein